MKLRDIDKLKNNELYHKLVIENGKVIDGSDRLISGVDFIRNTLHAIVGYREEIPKGWSAINDYVHAFFDHYYDHIFWAVSGFAEPHEHFIVIGIRQTIQKKLDTKIEFQSYSRGTEIQKYELVNLFRSIFQNYPCNIDYPKQKNIWTELSERNIN
jgi:hypothetical protein